MDTFTMGNSQYVFLYNGSAYFDIINAFPDEPIIDILYSGKFSDVCRIAEIMAEQGELLRRYQGHDKGAFFDADNLTLTATPAEAIGLKAALINAVTRGLSREISDTDDDIDLGLAEINKKKE